MNQLKYECAATEGTQLYQIVVYLTHSELAKFGSSLYFSKENASDRIGNFIYSKGLQNVCFIFDGEGYVLFRFIINSVSAITGELIIPAHFEPPIRTLRATIPEK